MGFVGLIGAYNFMSRKKDDALIVTLNKQFLLKPLCNQSINWRKPGYASLPVCSLDENAH
jgi:hypothetical protein